MTDSGVVTTEPARLMDGRVCLVTGASSGIGRETALALARMGATVVMHGRDPDRAAAAADAVRKASPRGDVKLVVADLPSQAEVRRRIAFYASTRTYFPVLEAHGFQEIGQRLHEMSLKGEWAEMGELVPDEMLEAFCVSGEYDEIAGKFVERYGGLLDEVCFTVFSERPPEEGQMRKMVRRLQEL